jgi:hypothetical protein
VLVASFRDLTDTVLDDARRSVDADRDDAEKAVNWSYLRACTLSRIARTSTLLTLVDGQGDYSLTNDLGIPNLVAPLNLTYQAAGSPYSVDWPQVGERSVTDLRGRYLVDWPFGRPGAYSITGDTLSLTPAAATGDVATLFYAYRPDEMTADDDEPDALPVEYHPVIEDGALERIIRRGRGIAPQVALQMAQTYRDRFLAGVSEIKEFVSQQQSSTPGYMAVGYPTRPRLPWPGNDYH